MPNLRLISVIAASLAVIFAIAACGSDESGKRLDATDADAINQKLDQVRSRADEGRCTGDNSALSSLTSLTEYVSSDALNYVSAETRADLEELLARLGEQIQSQCQQVSDLTTTSTETLKTETTTDAETTTEGDTTTTRDTSTTTREPNTPTRPPGSGGNNQGGNQGGGGPGGGNQGGGPTTPQPPPDNSGGIGPG